ncbi:MAG: HRDC domain-containing protein [Bdellovibrionales bacterium]|nr:HRDC domain-containing protein [Bdellovibrionales bacterium]
MLPFNILKWLFFSRFSNKYINSNGYIVLKDVNELEHRYKAKRILNRNLYRNEVVHHINGRKTDNSFSNLCVMDSQKHEHFHAWLSWKKQKTGKYPSIKQQKRVLEKEYSGTLLETATPYMQPSNVPVNNKHNQNQLFKELKKLRLKIANQKNIPAYKIFHDSHLQEMSKLKPTCKSTMLQIKGVGPDKLDRYGEAFISAIKEFKANLEAESA